MFGWFHLAAVAVLLPLGESTSPPEQCRYDLDFNDGPNGFTRGVYLDLVDNPSGSGHTTVLSSVLEDHYLIQSIECNGGYHGCRLFDTANPIKVSGDGYEYCGSSGSGDPDLGTPNQHCSGGGPGVGSGGIPGAQGENCVAQGNALIMDENGPHCVPDDRTGTNSIHIVFKQEVMLEELSILDGDGSFEYFKVYLDQADDTYDSQNPPVNAPILGPNSFALVPINRKVTQIFIKYKGSLAIPFIKYNTCDNGSNGGGDPHFQRWGQKKDTFHGECDLVLVHSDDFHGHGLDLHARTTIEDYFSYIESMALGLGDHILNIHKEYVYLDGVKYTQANLPLKFGDDGHEYILDTAPIEEGKNPKFYDYYQVTLGKDSSILFRFYKQYLFFSIQGSAEDFHDAKGLLGTYYEGSMLSREGDPLDDFKVLGFEWQVSLDDPKLFFEDPDRAPQLPFEVCRLPTAARPSRRFLRTEHRMLHEKANIACEHVKEATDFDLCVDDVMLTKDLGLADMWW